MTDHPPFHLRLQGSRFPEPIDRPDLNGDIRAGLLEHLRFRFGI